MNLRRTIVSALAIAALSPFAQSDRDSDSKRAKQSVQEAPELLRMRGQANDLYRSGKYLRAIEIYKAGYEQAARTGDKRSAMRFLNNLGGAEYQMFRYREATQTYLAARDLAAARGDRETLAALNVNLSSLYFQMGENDAALETAEQGLKSPREAIAKFRAKLLIQAARIRRARRESTQALALLREAIAAAQDRLDLSSEAQAWNELGNQLLEQGQLGGAERALLEAFRLRKLTRDPHLYFSYEALGSLRLRQGDLGSAEVMFDRAVDAARAIGPEAMWSSYYQRGRTKLAQNRMQEAYSDFGAALLCARRWRAEAIPADAFRVGADVELSEVYASYIELGGRLYTQTGRKQFAEQTFAAAEDSRAASLRALWAGPDLTKKLPAEYWQALTDLHRLEAAPVEGEGAVDPDEVRRLRLKVNEMEARAELDFPREVGGSDAVDAALLSRTQRVLRPQEVFIGFHLGERASCSWVVTQNSFEFRLLPPQAHFQKAIAGFVEALRADSTEARVAGSQLYSELFGSNSSRLLDRPIWIVAADGPLFEMPFAALVEKSGKGAHNASYVVEKHAIRFVPGLSALFSAAPESANSIVAVGDPIYNRADPRYPRSSPVVAASQITGASGAKPAELARLPGSAREIVSCARVWRDHGLDATLLTGGAANVENLDAALRKNPAIVHVATHILFPTQLSSPGMIALSLRPSAGIELLSATEIASLRVKLGLVVLDGCSSAHAETLPGAGLMGMTRAWLAAGAKGVIVTRWATEDQDQGSLFQYFYEQLAEKSGPGRDSFAELLQQSQLHELRVGGRRANPSYWAAYFCVQRN